MQRLYPSLASYPRITVYDVASRILSMFDASLANYAERVFSRQGIKIMTNHHVLKVSPEAVHTKEDGEVPAGCVVWSTGLAPNPLIIKVLKERLKLDDKGAKLAVDDHLRVQSIDGRESPQPMDDVFAIGDCAGVSGQELPATAQVANQQAIWLGKALNKAVARKTGERKLEHVRIYEEKPFKFRSLGIMAYLGGWRAITQSGNAGIKG